eukprot:Blabericola_migrator_1__8899@NODE_4706_length_1012_cov_89_784127_g2924_i0_p1_GENE_NODE_4706_length_1012_cov_89_784127_g2924_i0NODE_4706_length_1012_cov_89_784127_g2924_i0_p1_ORF_typecomplete_len145_score12_17_NODE_4706_length_1012_cov_89_784127_g2924_i0186620
MTILDDALGKVYLGNAFWSVVQPSSKVAFRIQQATWSENNLCCSTVLDFLIGRPRSIEEYIRRFESDVRHTTFEVCHLFESRDYRYNSCESDTHTACSFPAMSESFELTLKRSCKDSEIWFGVSEDRSLGIAIERVPVQVVLQA